MNQRQDGLGDSGDAEVPIAISNDTADQIIDEFFPDITDYTDLDADQRSDVHDEILKLGDNDKESSAMERVVERLSERFG